MSTESSTFLCILTSGLSTSSTTRFLQLALALEKASGRKLALRSASIGCLRNFSDSEQLALKRASIAGDALTRRDIASAPRFYLGTSQSVPRDNVGLASVVLDDDCRIDAKTLVALEKTFAKIYTLGVDGHPWPVLTRGHCVETNNENVGQEKLLIVCDDVPDNTIEKKIASVVEEVSVPVTLFDPNDLYAATSFAHPRVERFGPMGPRARKELFSKHRFVEPLDSRQAQSDIFVQEALALGVSMRRLVAPQSMISVDNCAKQIWQSLCLTDTSNQPLKWTYELVNGNEAVIATTGEEIIVQCQKNVGEIALFIDAAAQLPAEIEAAFETLPISSVYLSAADHGLLGPRLLQKSMAAMLRGATSKPPNIELCEAAATQAQHLRDFLVQSAQRLALILLPGLTQGLHLSWQRHIEAAKARVQATGDKCERRVLLFELGNENVTQVAQDHRIGASQASSDLALGTRMAALGSLSFVGMLPQTPRKRSHKVFLEPGSQLRVQAKRLTAASEWYIHELEAAMRQERVDALVSLVGPFLAGFNRARALWSQKNLPLVGVLHSLHSASLEQELAQTQMVMPFREFDTFISPSNCGKKVMEHLLSEARENLLRLSKDIKLEQPRIAVIPYGVEVEAYGGRSRYASRVHLGLPSRPLLLASVMRFSRYNKTDLAPLLVTLRLLRLEGYNVEIVLAGQINDVAEPARLRRLASSLGIGDWVHLRPNLRAADKQQLLAAADVFVALSDNVQETFGISLVEAMAAGRPIVASAWDGFREIVRDGQTGLLVPTVWRALPRLREEVASISRDIQRGSDPFDLCETVSCAPEALKNALKQLLDNEALRERMGEEARRVACTSYDRKRQGQKVVDTIVQAIHQSEAAPRQAPKAIETLGFYGRFGHYASDTPHEEDWLRASPLAKDASALAALFDAQYSEETDESERQIDLGLLRRLGEHGLSWAEARSQTCDDARLLRSLKYGLVTCSKAAPKDA